MLVLGLGLKLKSNVGGFSLTDVSGLQAWYKVDTDISASEGRVTQWSDQSGNGNHMTNTSATNKRPVYDTNFGGGAVSFEAHEGYLESASAFGGTNEFTVFIRVSMPFDSGATKLNPLITGQSSGDGIVLGNLSFLTGSYYAFSGDGSNQNYAIAKTTETTYPIVNATPLVFVARREGTSIKFYKDSISQVIHNGTESDTSATFDIDTLGKTSNGGVATILEVAFYNSTVTDDEFNKIINDIKSR